MLEYELKRIANNLKRLRCKKHCRFETIYKNTGITEERLRKIETRKASVTYKELYALSRFYEVAIDDLVFKDLK